MARDPVIDRLVLSTGLSVRTLQWGGAENAPTAIIIHHGLGEHAGRYQAYADHLPGEVPIAAYDCRGHGETEGPKGVVRGLTQLAEDFHAALPELRQRTGADNVIVFGHSMGAAAVGHYLTTHEVHDFVRGVWLSAVPAVVEYDLELRVKRYAAKWLDTVLPDMTMATGLKSEGISSVPSEIARYENDPLVHDRASIALGRGLFEDPPRLLERGSRLTWPILLWHGAEDPIANPKGTLELFEKVGASDKDLKILRDARHEVHHETEPIVSELMGWLSAWLSSHGAVAN